MSIILDYPNFLVGIGVGVPTMVKPMAPIKWGRGRHLDIIKEKSVQVIPNSVPKVNTFGIVNFVSNDIALHNEVVYKLHIYCEY